MTNIQNMTAEQMAAEIQRLKEQNARLTSKRDHKLTFAVSEKGAVSVYGMGKFPVTLYGEQWDRLLAQAPDLADFLTANRAKLSVKGDAPKVPAKVEAPKGTVVPMPKPVAAVQSPAAAVAGVAGW